MDTPSKIPLLRNSWATSLVFSDAYHRTPIRPDCHKYLASQLRANIYQYKVCPFGLSPIPQVITSAMELLKQHARLAMDIAMFKYIDDWLLIFEEPNLGARKTMAFAAFCMNFGLLVNLDKSELVLSQRITHLSKINFVPLRLTDPFGGTRLAGIPSTCVIRQARCNVASTSVSRIFRFLAYESYIQTYASNTARNIHPPSLLPADAAHNGSPRKRTIS